VSLFGHMFSNVSNPGRLPILSPALLKIMVLAFLLPVGWRWSTTILRSVMLAVMAQRQRSGRFEDLCSPNSQSCCHTAAGKRIISHSCRFTLRILPSSTRCGARILDSRRTSSGLYSGAEGSSQCESGLFPYEQSSIS
jgi:hypothetical protein